MENSFWSLVPSLVTIALAMITKRMVPSLLLGVLLGATMICDWNPAAGFLKMVESYIIPSIGSPWNATVLLYGAAFGGLIVILQKSGGIYAIAEKFSKIIRTKQRAELGAFILGLFVFVDDYFSCLTVGTVMRPICDKLKVAREKLSFLVDTTAAPVCLLVPISTWVVYVVGLIGQEIDKYPEKLADRNPFMVYLSTIPLNFYAILALVATLWILVTKISLGAMRKAEERTETTGQLWRPDSSLPASQDITELAPPPGITAKLSQIIIPFVVMFIVLAFMFLYTGGYWNKENIVTKRDKLQEVGAPVVVRTIEKTDTTVVEQQQNLTESRRVIHEKNPRGIAEAIGNSKSAFSILIAVLAAGICALIMGTANRFFTLGQGMDHYITGMKGMYGTAIILVLAWSMSSVTKDLGTAKYVESCFKESISPAWVPALLFIFGCIISFATGTSYGTFAILIPLAVPLAVQMNLPIEYTIAAVFSGGVFGDHASPVSDTTILSSASSVCDLMDHTMTQLPYTLIFAVATVLAFAAMTFLPILAACGIGLVATLGMLEIWRFKSRPKA